MPTALLLALLVMLAFTAMAAAGAWLAWSGLRGERQGHHPRCRACGYDLVGHAFRPATCPECASMLRRPDAVRIGRWRPCTVRLACGTGLLGGLLAATIIAGTTAGAPAVAPVGLARGAAVPPLAGAPRTLPRLEPPRGPADLRRVTNGMPSPPAPTARTRDIWRTIAVGAYVPEAWEPEEQLPGRVEPPEPMVTARVRLAGVAGLRPRRSPVSFDPVATPLRHPARRR